MYEIFQAVKHGNNYNALACVLQKFESQLILHNICSEINNNHPEIPLFTIHDSAATTSNNIQLLKFYFHKKMQEIFGFSPKMDISE